MATVTKGVAHFTWTDAAGQPNGYLWETTTGQDGLVRWGNHVWIPWQWPGIGEPFQLRVQAARIDDVGIVREVGPVSLWSEPTTITPVPEPGGLALVVGIIALVLLAMVLKEK